MVEYRCTAPDGMTITYGKTGHGPALICLHGSGMSKELWEQTGWLAVLAENYTVITPDLRGFGHSGVPHTEDGYTLDCVLGDLQAVAAACGITEYRLFGHSYGATILYQAVRAELPVVRAVCASGSMGPEFFTETCPREAAEYKLLADAKKQGTLAQLPGYSPEDIAFVESQDVGKFAAMFAAWSHWKPVTPKELNGKVSLYSGTADFNAEAVENTSTRREELKACGLDTACFEGLNHDGLIGRRDVCQAWVLEHLA